MRDPDGSVRFIHDEAVVGLGRTLAAATNYTGLAHIDMRYTGPDRKEVVLIEFNPRFWGSFAYSQSLGVDFMGLGLRSADGLRPAVATSAPTGVVRGLRGALRHPALLAGDFGTSRGFFRQKIGDLAPEAVNAGARLMGCEARIR